VFSSQKFQMGLILRRRGRRGFSLRSPFACGFSAFMAPRLWNALKALRPLIALEMAAWPQSEQGSFFC